ncbi:brassinosteroid-responsive RING protein 1-like [Prosopis cineraria]|uniref:brassinosteroid-responsive RING protein 1-like n=1 Tax=Prosopis cineraria TaxID=364024 RepID=UPI0024106D1A|nr:brassinosteroid-responsive RING protein 1-like [Prosopis cineraria]
MGFPVSCAELVFPKLLIQILAVFGFLRTITSFLLRSVGLPDFLEPDIHYFWDSQENAYFYPTRVPEFESASSVLIREMLPVVKFSELEAAPESCCAVCLYEFDGDDEIRQLTNCTHVFHRGCLDRWMGYDRRTCPLCRAPFTPHHMQAAFNHSLWAASGIPEFYPESDSELLL